MGTPHGVDVKEELLSHIRRHSIAILLVVATGMFMTALLREHFLVPKFRVSSDSAMFLHGGWYILNGATPYVSFWDPKPPLVFATTTMLAVLSGGNMHILFWLSVVLSSAVAIVAIALVYALVHETTEDRIAALCAGLSVLVFPPVYFLAPWGIQVKPFTLMFGLGAVLFAIRQRYFLAGIAGALSAGFWQFGVLFPLVTVGVSYQHGEWHGVRKTCTGGLAIGAIVLGALAGIGALEAAITESILAPIVASEPSTIGYRVYRFADLTGYALPVVIVGLYGAANARSDLPSQWWVVTLVIGYTCQIFFLDFDGYNDLIPFVFVVALGVGVLVADLQPTRKAVITCAVVVVIFVSPLWIILPAPPLQGAVHQAGVAANVTDSGQIDVPEHRTQEIFLNKEKPASCHYRLSRLEIRWIQLTDRTLAAQTCGDFPSADVF